jgi:branched-chain amino acid transport system permease protein
MKRNLFTVYAAFTCILFISPVFLNAYWVDVLNNVGIYTLLALSLNVSLGHAGLFNVGLAAFYAIGAYTTAILNTMCDIPILWLFPISGIAAGIFALIVFRPIIHLRGDYLCIATVAVVEIVRIALVNNVFGITNGSNGIFGIDRPSLFGFAIRKPHHFFYFIWIFAAVTVFLLHRLENSRVGRAFNYLREDETAAEGNGINTTHYKNAAFVFSAVWAGMVGNIFAAKMTTVTPESFSIWESVLIFIVVILGGAGSLPGVILGAFLIIGLPEVFRGFANARMMVFGAAMVFMMIFRTEGFIPPSPRNYSYLKFLGSREKA